MGPRLRGNDGNDETTSIVMQRKQGNTAFIVMPAQAGIHGRFAFRVWKSERPWVPAYAGTTSCLPASGRRE